MITRIDVIGRPKGSTDFSTWRTIETMIRPSSLTDFQTFTATSVTYATTATTTGPIFVGEDKNGVPGNLTHNGTAKANLYAEGTVGGTHDALERREEVRQELEPDGTLQAQQLQPGSVQLVPVDDHDRLRRSGSRRNHAHRERQHQPCAEWAELQRRRVEAQPSSRTGLSSSPRASSYSQTVNGNTDHLADYDGTNPPVCGTARLTTVPSERARSTHAVDVLVSGVVKGKVTVASSADIVFGGNTTYNANGTDVLGLEAQGTLYVAQWAMVGSMLNLWAAELSLSGPFEADPLYNWARAGR